MPDKEELERLDRELASLSPRERTSLARILREKAEKGSSDHFYQLAAEIYEELPVPMEDYLFHPDFLNMRGVLYPKVADILIECDDPSLREFYLVLGKGSGKSAIVSIEMSRMVYRTLCFRNPQNYYGLMDGSPIAILNMSINAEQAQKVVFTEFCSRLYSCPWFHGKFQEKFREVQFMKSVVALAGHSGSTSWLGYNTLFGCLDEANFFLDEGNRRSVAEDLLSTLEGSLRTRFPNHYKLGVISSVRTHDDFLFSKVRWVQENGVEKRWDDLGKGVEDSGFKFA